MRMIDADALKKALLYETDDVDKVDFCWSVIDKQPTADARKNVRGRWIECASSEHCKCSICGHRALIVDGDTEWLSVFCPYCGAKMVGLEEEEGDDDESGSEG